jgi:protein-tyrosine phosphatase
MALIFWIKGNPFAPLAIVRCPQGDAELENELQGYRQGGIQTLVSHLAKKEAASLGLEDEGPLAEQLGMRFFSYPIPDAHVPPDTDGFRSFVGGLADRLRAGEHIGVHCRGSIGRSTVTAACTLIHLGWTPKAALDAVETARCCPVPDTEEQRRWILRYKAQP